MLLIMVGALIVGSIETAWEGPTSPYPKPATGSQDAHFARGDEFGRFLLGSTVILCFEPGRFAAQERLVPGCQVRMGEAIGTWQV